MLWENRMSIEQSITQHKMKKSTYARLRPFLGPVSLLAIVAIFGTLYPDTFLSPTNLVTNILESVAFVGIVAAAQTVVMVVGDFDLAVGGLAAFATSTTAGMLTTAGLDGTPHAPGAVLPAVLIGLAVGVVGGAISGFLVSYVGVLAFIATLGMAGVFSSFAYYASDGKPVYGLVEHNFVDIARDTSLGLSNKIWIMLVFAGIIWFLLDQTPLGRRMYAVGGNPEAARYSGINTKLIRMIAFTICGVGAALGGLLGAASTATANVTATQPFMLNSIAAVFIGMAMFRNGKPNLPGTILGVITLRTLENGLNFTSINDFLQSAITGAVVVIAVIPSALSRIRQSR
jgi:ribose transport system permease protein